MASKVTANGSRHVYGNGDAYASRNLPLIVVARVVGADAKTIQPLLMPHVQLARVHRDMYT